VFVVCLPQRIITYFEYSIESNSDCFGLERYTWVPMLARRLRREFKARIFPADDSTYYTFSWYYIPLVQTFIPFCSLVFLNLGMIYYIKKRGREFKRSIGV
jgi:hypothetical protein